jgi:hypothetical protein
MVEHTVIWYLFYRSKERAHIPEEDNLRHSTLLVWPLTFLFWSKIVLVMLAYWFILKFLLVTIGGAQAL